MMAKRYGWQNSRCRGRNVKWLYSCYSTGCDVCLVTEFVCGGKCRTLEVSKDGKVLFACDADVGYLAFEYAKRMV